MLRLEFHVNQCGLKRLHWSTSSWLTAPPQPISRRGAVTSLQCASLAADAQCSVHLYRWKWITVSWEPYFRTGHCYMYLSVTAVRLPGDPLTLNEPSYDPSWLYSPVFIRLYGHIAKGSSHNMHRPREVTVICVLLAHTWLIISLMVITVRRG